MILWTSSKEWEWSWCPILKTQSLNITPIIRYWIIEMEKYVQLILKRSSCLQELPMIALCDALSFEAEVECLHWLIFTNIRMANLLGSIVQVKAKLESATVVRQMMSWCLDWLAILNTTLKVRFFHMKIKHKIQLIALSLTLGIKWQHLETRWLVRAMNHNNFTPIAKYSFWIFPTSTQSDNHTTKL